MSSPVWKQKESSRREGPDQVGCAASSTRPRCSTCGPRRTSRIQIRTLGYLLARTPKQLIYDLGTNLGLSGIDYALTGAAGATLVAPFVTAVPVAEVWVSATAAPEELYDAAKADPVNDGQNVVFLQAKNDAPLVFREMTEGLWVANRFRLYADLRRDPRRGREQAEHLREEVIGF